MEFSTLKDNELEQWFDHLALVFEATGRPYFVRHWVNDPYASVTDIFVAYDASKAIASTLKVYRREFYFDSQSYKVGGIGEVSTKPEFRSQGLAHKLLDLSVSHMTRSGMTISSLSASKARKYYENLGWHVVPFKISSQKLNAAKLISRTHEKDSIQAADFSEKEASQLIPLHHFYAQHFNGTHCRSDIQYWTKWIKAESGVDNAWVVLEADGKVGGFACFGMTSPSTLVVKDFCVGPERWEHEQGRETLQQLLEHYVRHKQQEIGDQELIVKYPSATMGDSGKLYLEEDVEVERKESYLYRVLGGAVSSEVFIKKMERNFVFWDVDKF